MKKNAIILGITGVTGGLLAQQLFKDTDYEKVISLHRRKSGLNHPKLEEIIIDPGNLLQAQVPVVPHVVFCCIGTTMAKAGSKEAFKQVDYEIPVMAARFCKQHNIPTLLVISAMGADADSKIFYNRVKGQMEKDVLKIHPTHTYFARPALIASDREEKRFTEQLAIWAFKVLNPVLVGPFKKYRSIRAEVIARALRAVAITGYSEPVIPSDVLQRLGGR